MSDPQYYLVLADDLFGNDQITPLPHIRRDLAANRIRIICGPVFAWVVVLPQPVTTLSILDELIKWLVDKSVQIAPKHNPDYPVLSDANRADLMQYFRNRYPEWGGQL